MTPLYMNNCPVPQFPHLSNVSPAVPAHRAVGTVHRCSWDVGGSTGRGEVRTQFSEPDVTPLCTPTYTPG